jgi:tRNA nucleotidyltransferase (CCA-adding enzyme)
MDLTSLYHTFPKELHNFFSEIKDFNFKLAIVGGFCRDYLKYQTLSKDLDLEIRPLNMQPGIINTVELYEFLSKKYETELLNFNILRVKIGEYECEISLPRLEEFNSNFSHSNFDVEFIQDLDYTLGPIRRDFTLNAIYFEYGDNFSVIDPLEGIAHLKASKLVACSKSFGRDPVRFLRLLRFMIKEDFSADELLLSQFKKIPLTAYSAHYLKLESIKSTKPLTFLL